MWPPIAAASMYIRPASSGDRNIVMNQCAVIPGGIMSRYIESPLTLGYGPAAFPLDIKIFSTNGSDASPIRRYSWMWRMWPWRASR